MSELTCKPFAAWEYGDSVRCVDAMSSAADCLVFGSVYKINGIDKECMRVSVDGVQGYWNFGRFDFVTPDPAVEPNAYADWKSGDSVRCIDDLCSKGLLHSQHVYEIEQIDHSDKLLCLIGIPKNWGFARFERVAPIVDVHSEPDKPVVRVGSRVRCDDASGTDVMLVEGNVYTVASVQRHDCDTFLRLNDVIGMGWNISRFTLLPDEVAPVVPASQADLADADLMHADEARRKCDERFMEHCRELRHVAKTAIESAIDGGDASACIEVPHGDYYPLQRWLSRLGYGLSVDAKKIGCVLARISW